MKNYKIMVYTAIFNDNESGEEYDNLNEISKLEKNVDYYCFTNNSKLKSDTWKIILIDNPEHLDATRLNRKIKILGGGVLEENYDLAVYVDGSVEFKLPISEFIKDESDFENYDFYSLKHPDRDCIYEEAIACKELNKDNVEDIDRTIQFLKKEKYPAHFGLTANGFFVRKTKDKNILKIQKKWWEMVKNYSKRDQLSFMYCIWKQKYKRIKYLDLLWYDNKYYFMHDHNKTSNEIIKELQRQICILETDLENEKENYKIILTKKEKRIVDLETENENLKNNLEKILKSKRWQLINKFCFFDNQKSKKGQF